MESVEPDRVEAYEDDAGEWRWRRKAPNGQIISVSGEGYESRSAAIKAAHRVNDAGAVMFSPEEGDDG